METRYELYYCDYNRRPWSFTMQDDDGRVLFESKDYLTKAAASSAAARRIKKHTTATAAT